MADPTLPQLTVTTTDPFSACERTVDCSTTNGTLANAAARQAAFESAVTNAKYRDLILIEPGETYTTNLTLGTPAASFGTSATSGYVVIRPRGFDTAVPIGTHGRLMEANQSSMTKLQSASSGVCTIQSHQSTGAEYWWISGLEVTPKSGETLVTGAAIVGLISTSDGTNPTTFCDHIVIDRCYVHGNALNGQTAVHGVIAVGTYIGVINTSIDDIKTTFEGGGADNQAFYGAYGAGPFLLHENLLGATCENTLFETPTLENLSNCTIAADGVTVTRASGFPYDAAGASFNVTGSNTVTVSSRDSVTQITLASAITGVSLPFTGTAYATYSHADSWFPSDITITRNYYRKKASWDIHDATFDITGGDSGLTNCTILASDDHKIQAGTFTNIAAESVVHITGGTGWITGYATCLSIDGSGNALMNRDLGTAGSTGGTIRRGYSCKNLIEFKSGQRILIEGNVFELSWAGGGQIYAIATAPRFTAPVRDITIRYNKLLNVYGLAQTNSSNGVSVEPGPPSQFPLSARLTLKHNLFTNVRTSSASPYYAPGSDTRTFFWPSYSASSVGTWNGDVGTPRAMDDFVFEHNTLAGANCEVEATAGMMGMGDGTDPAGFVAAKRFIFRNNAIYAGAGYPFKSLYNSTTGTTVLDQVTPNTGADARIVTKNIFFDTAETGTDFTHAVDSGNTWTTTANRSTIGFTDYAGGNFIITGANATAATDGTMIGADIGTLNTKINGVASAATARLYLPIRWP